MNHYRAPFWLPGGNLQTLWAATLARHHLGPPPQWRRERWATPDGDFVDVDHLVDTPPPAALEAAANLAAISAAAAQADAPASVAAPRRHLVLLHGLEGSSASAYAQAFATVARRRGWAYSVPHFRGCSGTLNLAPRAYHSGDFEEVGWMLARLRAQSALPLLVVGVSLGGNALLRWAEEAGSTAAAVAAAVAAVSAPVDLAAAGNAIDNGLNRWLYARMFLRTMKPRALAKWQQHPGLFDRDRLASARTLYEFDNVFTAPLHGFRDTPDYWRRASARPRLASIRIPALVLNACNDPFMPASALPAQAAVGRHVTLWQPGHGGHVGFPGGFPPGHVLTMPQAVVCWLAELG